MGRYIFLVGLSLHLVWSQPEDINFKVASGNIRRIRLVNQLGANVYDILRHEKLVLSLTAVRALEERLA